VRLADKEEDDVVRTLILLATAAATLAAQPFINYRGVVNAASYAPPGLPRFHRARLHLHHLRA
jgi:hypothetical protein